MRRFKTSLRLRNKILYRQKLHQALLTVINTKRVLSVNKGTQIISFIMGVK